MADNEVPYWAYDLLINVIDYEDVHGDHREGWTCFHDALDAVPAEVRDTARAIGTYQRQKQEQQR